jgi:hypothetical protein
MSLSLSLSLTHTHLSLHQVLEVAHRQILSIDTDSERNCPLIRIPKFIQDLFRIYSGSIQALGIILFRLWGLFTQVLGITWAFIKSSRSRIDASIETESVDHLEGG